MMSHGNARVIISMIVVLSSPAIAKAAGPWYLSGGVGYAKADDVSGTDSSGAVPITVHTEGGNGHTGQVAIGRHFGSLRGELELGGVWGHYGDVTVNGTKFDASSDVHSYALVANAFYDVSAFGNVKPYIGGGVGKVRSTVDSFKLGGQAVHTSSDSATDNVFIAEIGIAFPVTPRLAVVPSVRYVRVNDRSGPSNGTVAKVLAIGFRLNL
jgi:opacity protein-like surface antigen